ncbi:MAG: hypothetical protein RL687_491, partial [Candidatus Parcubacteria bacterium]
FRTRMHKPELTIIIPCYNCAQTLKEAVDSCYVQNLNSFEIVMVDDGSTDGTYQLMEELRSSHDNIRIFKNEKNLGGGATRNRAVQEARADIIFCLDSDDILPEGSLCKMLSYMKEKECDAVGIHTSIKFRGNDTSDIIRIDEFGFVGEQIPLNSLIQRPGEPLNPLYSTFMFTKEAFEKSGGYTELHGFDTQSLAWRFLSHNLRCYTCKDASYLHRQQSGRTYYVREYEDGKVNYNWFEVLIESLILFKPDIQRQILNFNFSKPDTHIFSILIDNTGAFRNDIILDKIYTESKFKEIAESKNPIDMFWLACTYITYKRYTEALLILKNIHAEIPKSFIDEKISFCELMLQGLSVKDAYTKATSDRQYIQMGSKSPIIHRIIRKLKRQITLYFKKFSCIKQERLTIHNCTGILLYPPGCTQLSSSDKERLLEHLVSEDAHIIAVERLLYYWADAQNVRKDIWFELQKPFSLEANTPEPQSFSKERFNPFLGPILVEETYFKSKKKELLGIIKGDNLNNTDLKISIAKGTVGVRIPKLRHILCARFAKKIFLNHFIRTYKPLRDSILFVSIIKRRILAYLFQHSEKKNYLLNIERIIREKEIIVKIPFGGLGDCLVYTSLPRLLYEKYGVKFYLDESCRDIFRNSEIFDLCFGKNPYFHGFKKTTKPYEFREFVQISQIYSEKSRFSLTELLEKDFCLNGEGLPEIFYTPKKQDELSNTILIDNNWYSGRKWGLYNDMTLQQKKIEEIMRDKPNLKIQYVTPTAQSIFEYIDMLHSAAFFISLFSGGNALAAALHIPAIVIVPENIEGASLSYFHFSKSNITYIRNKKV